VATLTGFSANAVYRAVAAGELRASKMRGRLRIRLADVEAWIEENVVAVEPLARERVAAADLAPEGGGRGLLELLKEAG
jgi:excisionase family DNA binding protein